MSCLSVRAPGGVQSQHRGAGGRFGPGLRGCLGLLAGLVCLVAGLVVPVSGRAETDEPDWLVTAKTKFLFHSHTSYEFGNPVAPYQKSLSRLEFPLDSTWLGVTARRRLGRASLGLEYLASLGDQSAGTFKDSDWDDEDAPKRRTVYSESQTRLRASYQLGADIDLLVSDRLGLPPELQVRPVVGFRWQHLSFLIHDGTQSVFDSQGTAMDVMALPGDTIAFKQDWYQYFLGLRLGYAWRRPPWLRWLRCDAQGDVGRVEGHNEDKHLRRGDRLTREDTIGRAWHVNLGLTLGLTDRLGLGLEWEYLNIESFGTHKLLAYGQGMRWSHGVKVWSDQSSLALTLAYRF